MLDFFLYGNFSLLKTCLDLILFGSISFGELGSSAKTDLKKSISRVFGDLGEEDLD